MRRLAAISCGNVYGLRASATLIREPPKVELGASTTLGVHVVPCARVDRAKAGTHHVGRFRCKRDASVAVYGLLHMLLARR